MEQLTIFFNKRTGTIKELCGGEQDMDWFGDEKQDYEQIYDYIIVEFDQFILANFHRFHIVDGALKIIENHIPEKYM